MSNIKQRIRFLEADAKHHDVKSSSIMMVSTRTALAIVEAFRDLDVSVQAAAAIISELKESLSASGKMQQLHREAAQAAEAKLAEERCVNSKLREDRAGLASECNALEAQLAELAKQKPAAWLNTRQGDPTWPSVFVTEEKAAANREWVTLAPRVKTQPLFTRPAPAADLAELVPPMKDAAIPGKNDSYIDRCDGWNACRAEMLRRIEELK